MLSPPAPSVRSSSSESRAVVARPRHSPSVYCSTLRRKVRAPGPKRGSTPLVETRRVACCGKVAKVGDRDGRSTQDRRRTSRHLGVGRDATFWGAQFSEDPRGWLIETVDAIE